MPNTTWTRRAKATGGQPKPQHREITQQNKANTRGEPKPQHREITQQNKANTQGEPKPQHREITQQNKANTRGEPKPQHREITQQNKAKHTGRAKAPTHGKHTGRAEAPTQERATENPKYQPHGSTKTVQPEGEKKKGKQTQHKGKKKKKKQGRQRKAKESTGTKKGEKKRRRADRPAQGRSENESMVAWANHRNSTGKPKNTINGNLQTGPSQSPSSGRHSNISNPVRERGHCHTCAELGEEGKEVLIGSQPLVPPPGPS